MHEFLRTERCQVWLQVMVRTAGSGTPWAILTERIIYENHRDRLKGVDQGERKERTQIAGGVIKEIVQKMC